MPHIECNGIRFNYRVEGPSQGSGVTLSHGLATNLSMWDDLAVALAPNYRVLRYDARERDRSESPNGNYSWDMLVDDIKCILDHLGIGKTHFVGLSMGGMVGLGLALDHPQRVRSLAARDARAVATREYNKGWRERTRIVRNEGIESLVERTLKRWFTPAFLARPAALDKMRAMMGGTSRDGYCGCAAALQTLDYQRRLGEIRLPTLNLVGAQDLGAPPEEVRVMHMQHRDRATPKFPMPATSRRWALFNAAVRSFIDAAEAQNPPRI